MKDQIRYPKSIEKSYDHTKGQPIIEVTIPGAIRLQDKLEESEGPAL